MPGTTPATDTWTHCHCWRALQGSPHDAPKNHLTHTSQTRARDSLWAHEFLLAGLAMICAEGAGKGSSCAKEGIRYCDDCVSLHASTALSQSDVNMNLSLNRLFKMESWPIQSRIWQTPAERTALTLWWSRKGILLTALTRKD